MTTTALAFPDPDGFDRDALNREMRELLRWAGATLADPTGDPELQADLNVTLGSFDVFNPARRDKADPGLRADLLDIYRQPPKVGGMFDAVYGASMNVAYRNGREVA